MTIRVVRLLDFPRTIWLSAEVLREPPAGSFARTDLVPLQGAILQHNLRLQTLAASLSERTGCDRRRGRSKLVERLDLERQRLGRELHSGVGQALAAIRLQLEIIEATGPAPSESVQGGLNRIRALAETALQQVRSVSHRLHPPEWQRLTLVEALRQLWNDSGVPQRYQARLETAPDFEDPGHACKVLLYRAAQEAISNLIRHARATAASLTLRREDGNVVLHCSDNGAGFDPALNLSGPPTLSAGIGLRSLREEAESLGGQFRIRSGANGTTLEVSIPMRAGDE